jgi:rhodanese-related sulfurtransferase
MFPARVNSANVYKQLTANQCDSLIKANELNPNFIILDVRTPTEWNGYHLLGSINNSTGSATFDADLAALPKHKLYLLHCQSGGRSAGAFAKMKTLGFAVVYEMIGGLNSWNAAKLPTTTVVGPKLMIVGITKSTKNAANDTTIIKVTNRSNGKLTFSKIDIKDDHSTKSDFDLAKTLNGAEDYSFKIIHQTGFGDSTKVGIESNGGNLAFAIANSVSVNSVNHILTELNIYPNPASDNLRVESANGLIREISIFDITGKLIFRDKPEKNPELIDVSTFKAGIYLSVIQVEQQTITRKIVIRR